MDEIPSGSRESTEASDEPTPQAQSRLQLLWDGIVFQLKLVVDGLRDVVLVPVSLIAIVAGLLFGGRRPDVFFRQVLALGRRTEQWINLFGYRRSGQTSDDIIAPVKDKVFEQAEAVPWIKATGTRLNRSLDNVSDALERRAADSPSHEQDSKDTEAPGKRD